MIRTRFVGGAEAKLEALRARLREERSLLVAFSGGVDSTFLLAVARQELGDTCHAITCVSDTMAQSEVSDAENLAKELSLGPRHHVVHSNELDRPGFADNNKDRCALCKTELMEWAAPLAEELGILSIALGTNTDDLGDFRPGIAAARKHGAISPLVEADMNKDDVRSLSRQLGLRTWNKPQIACLSSRFPYGTQITIARLRQVDQFEDGLRAMGFGQLRVRYHDTIARIELQELELPRALAQREPILALGKRLGFTYVTMDLGGFRSGSLNETPLVMLRPKAAS